MKTDGGCWLVTLVLVAFLLSAGAGEAQAQVSNDESILMGLKLRFGGRYDDVRMCVASAAGAKGGIAADVSFFMDLGVTDDWTMHLDVPVMRPILFATAFKMLQFEPSVSFNRRIRTDSSVDVIIGPTVGLSLHYGPDYRSEPSGAGRRPSFFAMGPTLGGYFGLDFKRPDEALNFRLGLTPYITPLFSIGDPDGHKGWIAGGLLDGAFRWSVN